jgi:hypothetical protein
MYSLPKFKNGTDRRNGEDIILWSYGSPGSEKNADDQSLGPHPGRLYQGNYT